MSLLHDERVQAFARDTAARLRRFFPEQVAELDDASLHEAIARGVAEGRRLGFQGERDLSRFLNVLAATGWSLDGDNARWMRDYFDDPDVPEPSVRLERVVRELERRLTEQARAERLRREFGV